LFMSKSREVDGLAGDYHNCLIGTTTNYLKRANKILKAQA
jgi:hypothetical protein